MLNIQKKIKTFSKDKHEPEPIWMLKGSRAKVRANDWAT